MNVSFNGFNDFMVTMEADASLEAGDMVTISAQGKACPCAEDGAICGYAVSVRDGYAAVQICGYVNVPADKSLTAGVKKLSVDSNGKVKENTQGREFLVVCTGNESAGIIL